MSDDAPDELEVLRAAGPLDATVRPPGSKSVTNRALVCAALAHGTTTLSGVLRADDTEAMIGCLRDLGVRVALEERDGTPQATVVGVDGRPPAGGAVLDARLSGTTSRFIAPVAALVRGTVVLDGADPLRRRPMGDLLDALAHLGTGIEPLGEPGHLPVRITGDGSAGNAGPTTGGSVALAGDVSSQFLSALLLAAPCLDGGLDVRLTTSLVSKPYVELTADVMADFGAGVEVADDWTGLRVRPTGYRAVERFEIEADASAASYFAAAAAVVGGTVRIDGLGRASRQGDARFVDLLGRMGADVRWSAHAVEVTVDGPLHGIAVDMADISDTAQSLAAVAPYADSPTTVTGIGFIRGKETDRIAAVVTELRRLGVDAVEEPDGFTVRPGRPGPGSVRTYDDHRMAMSFAVLGLGTDGVRIRDPGCVAKTYPGFWVDLDRITTGPATGPVAPTP